MNIEYATRSRFFEPIHSALSAHGSCPSDGDVVEFSLSEEGYDAKILIEIEGVLATIEGLAREGRVGRRRLPRNPLQFAATFRTLTKHGSFDAALPIPRQLGSSATLGRLAEASAYNRGVYDRYLS